MPKRKLVPGDDHGYYADRLAEPELLNDAILLTVEANEIPFAVPVGKLRKGGHIEFLDRREAEKGCALLIGRRGFPNPRVIDLAPDYFELRWGDDPPFDGCGAQEPIVGLLLGAHYGYSDAAIIEHYQYQQLYTRLLLKRKQIGKL